MAELVCSWVMYVNIHVAEQDDSRSRKHAIIWYSPHTDFNEFLILENLAYLKMLTHLNMMGFVERRSKYIKGAEYHLIFLHSVKMVFYQEERYFHADQVYLRYFLSAE